MELEGSVKTYLRTGSWIGQERANPVETEKAKSYVRYNSVGLVQARDASGGTFLRFYWDGIVVAWVRIGGASEDTVEGRLKVTT